MSGGRPHQALLNENSHVLCLSGCRLLLAFLIIGSHVRWFPGYRPHQAFLGLSFYMSGYRPHPAFPNVGSHILCDEVRANLYFIPFWYIRSVPFLNHAYGKSHDLCLVYFLNPFSMVRVMRVSLLSLPMWIRPWVYLGSHSRCVLSSRILRQTPFSSYFHILMSSHTLWSPCYRPHRPSRV